MTYYTDRCARDPSYKAKHLSYLHARYALDPSLREKKKAYDAERRLSMLDSDRAQILERKRKRRTNPEYREAERKKDRERLYEPLNRINVLLIHARCRSKRNGMEFSISVDELLPIPTHCPVLGIELNFGAGDPNAWNRASIDRIDNTKGYIKGNVAIISKRANWLKNDGSPDELEKVAAWARRALEEGLA